MTKLYIVYPHSGGTEHFCQSAFYFLTKEIKE